MELVTSPMPEPFSVKRVDSGYGSLHTTSLPKRSYSSRRNSTISSMPSPTSSSSSTSSQRRIHSSRRPQHRASSTYMRCSTSMYRKPSPPTQMALFNFPGFGDHLEPSSSGSQLTSHNDPPSPTDFAAPCLSLPPQTTQYWTSDDTRRQEYAAIDAANRGVKGWVLRKLVPDCLLPKQSKQHVAFDDDTGSVRRYRLDLDDVEEVDSDASHEKAFRKSVFPWKRRRSCH